jgi:hypothetical protein
VAGVAAILPINAGSPAMIAFFCLRFILSLQQVNECTSVETLKDRICEFNSVSRCETVQASGVDVAAFIVCATVRITGPEVYENMPDLNIS